MICTIYSGYAADQLISRGVDQTLVRKGAQTFALIMPAGCLLSLSFASSDLTSQNAIGYFVLAVASAACCVS